MKVRTPKPQKDALATRNDAVDDSRTWNSPIERMRTDALAAEDKYILSHWNIESDTVVEQLTEFGVVAKEGKTDVPSVKATLLDDFSGTLLFDSGVLAKYRFRKCSFGKERIKHFQKIGRFGVKRFEPCAEVLIEYDGVRVGLVIAHMPDDPIGNCSKSFTITFSEDVNLAGHVVPIVLDAIIVVQDAILHRPRSVKRQSPEMLERFSGGMKPERKGATTIRLGETRVHICSEKRFRWTDYWIVGSHIRRHEVNGEIRTSVIEAYLKGPERESEEAKQFLRCYLESEAARKKLITL